MNFKNEYFYSLSYSYDSFESLNYEGFIAYIKDGICSTDEVLTYHVMLGSNVPSNVTSISSGLKYLASN